MKRIKSVTKAIMKVIKSPIILWPLMVLIFFQCIYLMEIGGGEAEPYSLSIKSMNVSQKTAYLDVLVKMDREDPNYVDFTKPPQRVVREYRDEIGRIIKDEYENLPITGESEIAKWNENGYISLTLHHKGVKEFQIRGGYNENDGSYSSPFEYLKVEGAFIEDFYEKYGGVRVAYVDEDGNVLNVTKASKKKYNDLDYRCLLVDGDSVVFQVGEAAPWIVGLFYILALAIPLYTIWLIIKFLIFLYKGFFI